MEALLVLLCGITPLLSFRAPLSLPLRFSAVLLLGAACLASMLLSGRVRRLVADRMLLWGLVGLGSAALLAAVLSPVRFDSLTFGFGEATSLPYWIACIAVFAFVLTVDVSRAVRTSVAVTVGALGALAAITVVQRLAGASPDQLPAGGSNYLGSLLVLGLPVALGVARSEETRERRMGWWAVAAVLGVAALSSGSSAAQVGVVAGLAAVAWLRPVLIGLAPGAARAARVALTVGLIVFVAGAAVGIVAPSAVPAPVGSVMAAISGDVSVASRLELWRAGMGMVAAQPVTGWGPDATEFGIQSFVSQRLFEIEGVSADPRQVMPQDPHSFPLTLGAELGLAGLLAAALLGVAWVARVRNEPNGSPAELDLRASFACGVGAFLVTSLAVPWATSQGLTAVLFAGLAIAGGARGQSEPPSRSIALGVSAVAAVVAVALSGAALMATAEVEDAFATATDAAVLSARLAAVERYQPTTLRSYQRLWAEANRVGADVTPDAFIAAYGAAPESVRQFAPHATHLAATVLGKDRSAQSLDFATDVFDGAAARAPHYPDPVILGAGVAALRGDSVEAKRLLSTVEWADESSYFEQVSSQVGQTAP